MEAVVEAVEVVQMVEVVEVVELVEAVEEVDSHHGEGQRSDANPPTPPPPPPSPSPRHTSWYMAHYGALELLDHHHKCGCWGRRERGEGWHVEMVMAPRSLSRPSGVCVALMAWRWR